MFAFELFWILKIGYIAVDQIYFYPARVRSMRGEVFTFKKITGALKFNTFFRPLKLAKLVLPMVLAKTMFFFVSLQFLLLKGKEKNYFRCNLQKC